jgi:histidine decarboxylase
VAKILRLQHTRNIMIKSQPDGQMDYDDLRETLRIHRDVTPHHLCQHWHHHEGRSR